MSMRFDVEIQTDKSKKDRDAIIDAVMDGVEAYFKEANHGNKIYVDFSVGERYKEGSWECLQFDARSRPGTYVVGLARTTAKDGITINLKKGSPEFNGKILAVADSADFDLTKVPCSNAVARIRAKYKE